MWTELSRQHCGHQQAGQRTAKRQQGAIPAGRRDGGQHRPQTEAPGGCTSAGWREPTRAQLKGCLRPVGLCTPAISWGSLSLKSAGTFCLLAPTFTPVLCYHLPSVLRFFQGFVTTSTGFFPVLHCLSPFLWFSLVKADSFPPSLTPSFRPFLLSFLLSFFAVLGFYWNLSMTKNTFLAFQN